MFRQKFLLSRAWSCHSDFSVYGLRSGVSTFRVLINFVVQAVMPATSVKLRALNSTRVCEHLIVDGAYTSVNVCRARILTPGHERNVKASSQNLGLKGGKFLKKLWCCVGGSITNLFRVANLHCRPS